LQRSEISLDTEAGAQIKNYLGGAGAQMKNQESELSF